MECQIIFTKDGSNSIYLPQLNEHYHSIHGAIQESQHVFIRNGLDCFLAQKKTKVDILEIGFGTGLNALLSFLKSKDNSSVNFTYTTIEPFPLPNEIIEKLNYAELLQQPLAPSLFQLIHAVAWNEPHKLSNNSTIHKLHNTIQEFVSPQLVDIIYFDAFAPEKQPEIWSNEVFQKLYNLLNHGGLLVTYCAKGIIKRKLKAIGFIVEALPGPPGKREMIRAMKS